MDKKGLMKFCGDKGDIKEPWSKGDYTYATNGHIFIKILRISDIPENNKAPDVEGVKHNRTPEKWHPVQNIKAPKREPCDNCKGKRVDYKCPECCGNGTVDLSNSYNTYTVDCKSCESAGTVLLCEECNGTGKVAADKEMIFNGFLFNQKYLALLSELPNCEIGLVSEMKPNPFRFQGGEGALMPMRNRGV